VESGWWRRESGEAGGGRCFGALLPGARDGKPPGGFGAGARPSFATVTHGGGAAADDDGRVRDCVKQSRRGAQLHFQCPPPWELPQRASSVSPGADDSCSIEARPGRPGPLPPWSMTHVRTCGSWTTMGSSCCRIGRAVDKIPSGGDGTCDASQHAHIKRAQMSMHKHWWELTA
jgi:hypothetical protein